MFDIIETAEVTVLTPTDTGKIDDMGEPVAGVPAEAKVDGVLFDPTAVSELTDSLRLGGERVDVTFYFPASFGASLRGCSIVHRGRTYAVVGDIRRYPDSPATRIWNGVAAAKEVLG